MYPGFARGLGWRGRRMKGGQLLAPATARLFIAGTSPPAVQGLEHVISHLPDGIILKCYNGIFNE